MKNVFISIWLILHNAEMEPEKKIVLLKDEVEQFFTRKRQGKPGD